MTNENVYYDLSNSKNNGFTQKKSQAAFSELQLNSVTKDIVDVHSEMPPSD